MYYLKNPKAHPQTSTVNLASVFFKFLYSVSVHRNSKYYKNVKKKSIAIPDDRLSSKYAININNQ